jgi:hypothetical protein
MAGLIRLCHENPQLPRGLRSSNWGHDSVGVHIRLPRRCTTAGSPAFARPSQGLGEVALPCICLECHGLRAGATSGILAHVYCVASRQTKGLEQARKPTLSNHAASRSGERNPREKSTCLVLDHSLIIRNNVSAPWWRGAAFSARLPPPPSVASARPPPPSNPPTLTQTEDTL